LIGSQGVTAARVAAGDPLKHSNGHEIEKLWLGKKKFTYNNFLFFSTRYSKASWYNTLQGAAIRTYYI